MPRLRVSSTKIDLLHFGFGSQKLDKFITDTLVGTYEGGELPIYTDLAYAGQVGTCDKDDFGHLAEGLIERVDNRMRGEI